MRLVLLLGVLCALLTGSVCLAVDFEITDVVQIGPVYSGGMLKPAQWSPDGSSLAYFRGDELTIADNRGQSRYVASLEFVPRRFEWISNDELVVYEKLIVSANESRHRLTRIDISTGASETIDEFTHRIFPRDENERDFNGPHLTVEGNAFYFVKENGRRRMQMVPRGNGQTPSPDRNHILRTGRDGLYLVKTDRTDSTKISNKPYTSYMGLPMNLSFDRSHIMFGGNIVRLADDKLTILDTLSILSNYTECEQHAGFGSQSLSPAYPEACFRMACGADEVATNIRVGLFDYTTNQFTVLDDLIGLSNCNRPVFSPDGRDLALISEGILYVVRRAIR